MNYDGGSTLLDQLPGGGNNAPPNQYIEGVISSVNVPPPNQMQQPMRPSEFPPQMGPPQQPTGGYVSEPGGQYTQQGFNGGQQPPVVVHLFQYNQVLLILGRLLMK